MTVACLQADMQCGKSLTNFRGCNIGPDLDLVVAI